MKQHLLLINYSQLTTSTETLQIPAPPPKKKSFALPTSQTILTQILLSGVICVYFPCHCDIFKAIFSLQEYE